MAGDEGYLWTDEKNYIGMPPTGDNLAINGNIGDGYVKLILVSIVD